MLTNWQKDTLLTVAFVAVMIIVALTSCGSTEPKGTLTTETYIVQSGDTLWTISEKYMVKNKGPRDIREFYQGIIELNYDSVFVGRVPGTIYPGDRLKINYWK
jgi:nucleoid-associated protein YgaU